MADSIRVEASESDAAEAFVERLRGRTGEIAARRLVAEMDDLRDRYGLDVFRVVSEPSHVQGLGVPDTFWRLGAVELDVDGRNVCFTVEQREYVASGGSAREDEWLLIGATTDGVQRLLQRLGENPLPAMEVREYPWDKLRALWLEADEEERAG